MSHQHRVDDDESTNSAVETVETHAQLLPNATFAHSVIPPLAEHPSGREHVARAPAAAARRKRACRMSEGANVHIVSILPTSRYEPMWQSAPAQHSTDARTVIQTPPHLSGSDAERYSADFDALPGCGSLFMSASTTTQRPVQRNLFGAIRSGVIDTVNDVLALPEQMVVVGASIGEPRQRGVVSSSLPFSSSTSTASSKSKSKGPLTAKKATRLSGKYKMDLFPETIASEGVEPDVWALQENHPSHRAVSWDGHDDALTFLSQGGPNNLDAVHHMALAETQSAPQQAHVLDDALSLTNDLKAAMIGIASPSFTVNPSTHSMEARGGCVRYHGVGFAGIRVLVTRVLATGTAYLRLEVCCFLKAHHNQPITISEPCCEYNTQR